MSTLQIRQAGPDAAPLVVALLDDAMAWLVARGQSGQWGTEPFSRSPSQVARAQRWAAGGGLWLAFDDGDDAAAGAIVLGDAPAHVPAPARPELYVLVALTAAAWRRRGVGARMIEHAAAVARDGGAEQLRVDCWDGAPALVAHYRRLGFTRTGSFRLGDWPGAILTREL